jgi:MYXO-CTERM domain-containing protein
MPSAGYANNPLTDVRVFLPANAMIHQGDTATFQFTITAPSQLGTYTLGLRMVQEAVTFFGDTFRKNIVVTNEPPDAAASDDAGTDATVSSDGGGPSNNDTGSGSRTGGCGCRAVRGSSAGGEASLLLLGSVVAGLFLRARRRNH